MFWPQQSDLKGNTRGVSRSRQLQSYLYYKLASLGYTKEFQEQLSINFIKFDPVTCRQYHRERKNLSLYAKLDNYSS